MRRFIFRLVIKLIRKYFPEGITVIVDRYDNIIAYRWEWSKDLEDAVTERPAAERKGL